MGEITYDVIERYINNKLADKSARTKKRRRTDLRDFDSWLRDNGFQDPTAAKANDLDNYFRQQKGKGYANYTLESRWESIRGMYEKVAGMMNEMEESPFEHLKRKDYVGKRQAKKDREAKEGLVYVKEEEVKLLADNVPGPKVRNELLIRLLFQTGMRRNEIAGLEVEDVDTKEREIEVYDDKTQKVRVVYYDTSLDSLIYIWLNSRRPSKPNAESSPYLFISSRGQLSPQRVNNIVKEAADNAGIQEAMYPDMAGHTRYRITAHALRHGHGVHSINCGIDPKSVQKHMGHEDIDQTMEYVRLVESDVKDKYRAKWAAEV